ncbi:MAG TPA: FKBP-type peptidyl-prolyl cis-trans isomerase [Myxococcaceae bacterium]|nr:FKBP-type peptidyl-prolyl cis-trans isomerase [Myxococcaceae bacterium]
MRRLILVLTVALCAGCATAGASSGASSSNEVVEEPQLRVEELQVGTGDEAVAGKKVEINYTGRLADGRRFASSAKDGRPLVFTVGRGQVIRGVDEGVVGMKVGGKRLLVIPPRLAYGLPSAIPSDATVVYEVELLAVH